MASETFDNFDLSSVADSSGFTDISLTDSIDNIGRNRAAGSGSQWDLKTERMNEEKTPRRSRKKKLEIEESPIDMTVIDLPESVKIDPAVGWMVCVEGVDKGRAFRLVKGNNPIGRPGNGKTYALSLTDQGISRKGACGVIVYNEKSNQFYITPGDLTANINPYLDDEILLSPKLLRPRSVLEVAGDVLIFVPFCCDKFKWNFASPQEQASGGERPAAPQQDKKRRDEIVRCKKGHYYNAALNDSCPYCAAAEEENDPDGKTKIYY